MTAPTTPTSTLMPDDHVVVLFGATGDLARRKLLPGLLHLSLAGLVSLLVIPLVVYKFNPPEIKHTPMAAELGHSKLAEMGSMKPAEWILLGVFFLLLVLWIFGRQLGIHSATAALTGLVVLLLSGVLPALAALPLVMLVRRKSPPATPVSQLQ